MKETNLNHKIAYSCYLEVQLNLSDFGKSRGEHNEICNNELLLQIEQMQAEGINFSQDVDNEEFVRLIRSEKKESPPEFVWEHCSSSTANGRMG